MVLLALKLRYTEDKTLGSWFVSRILLHDEHDAAALRLAVHWFQRESARCALLYYRLGLGKCWDDAAAKLLLA